MPPATRLGDVCIDGDTIIPLLNGTKKKIRDLVGRSNFYVYSIDLKTKDIVPGLVNKVWQTGYSKCLKIILDNDECLIVTPNHKLIDLDGRFIEAKNLSIGQRLMPFYRQYKPIGSNINTKYEFVKNINNNQWKLTHRIVHEYKYGNDLQINNTTHHKDLNQFNNEPKNILACTQTNHFILHVCKNSTILKELAEEGKHPFQRQDVREKNRRRMLKNNPMKDKKIQKKKVATEIRNNGGVHPVVERNLNNNPMNCMENRRKMVKTRKAHPLGYHRGYVVTEETREKLRNKRHTLETKQKLSKMAKERAHIYQIDEIKKKRVKTRQAKKLGFNTWKELLIHVIKRTQTEDFDYVLKDMNLIGYENKDLWKNYIEEDYPINHKVVDIQVLKDIRSVYNMSVENIHTYAVDVGIFIKNCSGHGP